jgi:hypothetical protein
MYSENHKGMAKMIATQQTGAETQSKLIKLYVGPFVGSKMKGADYASYVIKQHVGSSGKKNNR